MELKIYNKSGELRLTASPNSSSTLTEEVGGECCVSASFTSASFAMLDAGDYVEVAGVRYRLKSPYRPTQKNTQTYNYSVKFYAPIHDAEDTLMLYNDDTDTRTEFSFDGGPREHLQLWVDNMNRRAGAQLWSIGTVISADNRTIDYRNVYCWDAAFGSNGIAASFETEMWADGYVINLCKAERGERIELGYLQGLTSLSQEENGEVKFFTRLFPLGSTRNIDATKYGHARLQLPSGAAYVDRNTDLYGVREAYEEDAFSDIYPKYTGTVSSVRTEKKQDEEGREYTVYYFKDNGMDWNPKDYEIPDLTYMLSFQTGELAGRGNDEGAFEAKWHNDTKEWEIVNVYPDSETQIPGGLIVPNPGDTYIPWNFALPQEYIDAAQQAYAEAVDDFLATYSFDTNKYNGTTDRNYVERNATPLMVGQNVRLLSAEYFTTGYRDTRITKVVRKLTDPCQATVTTCDEIGKGWKTTVDDSLNDLHYTLARQQETQIDVIRTTDTKTPSDYNVFSALRSRAEHISKKFNDTVAGILTFLQTAVFRAGAVFGKDGFASGPSGFGAKIDGAGNGEMQSLTLRRFLETPELRYNRVDIRMGDKWRAPGGGIIETVDTATKTATLKLEDGEMGAVKAGDICMGIYHSPTASDNAAADTDDGRGNRTFAGFCTVYFTITEVTGGNNGQFKYQLRPQSENWKHSSEPFAMMTFVCYGSFTDEERQTSVYETRTYTRMLWKQNTWEIGKGNIALQQGDLSNLNIFGMRMQGYSSYLNSVYFTGEITQTKPDGTPIRTANDRGAWSEAEHYDYYDRVSYNGRIWLCVNEGGTDTEPTKNNPDWLLEVDRGADGSGYSVSLSTYERAVKVDAEGNVYSSMVTKNVTAGSLNVVTGERNVTASEFLLTTYIQAFRADAELLYATAAGEGTYSVSLNPHGCTAEADAGTVRIVSITDYDNCYVDILVDCEGNATFEKRFSISVIRDGEDGKDGEPGKDGADGEPGKDGAPGKDAVTYRLIPLKNVVGVYPDGTYKDPTIRCGLTKNEGGTFTEMAGIEEWMRLTVQYDGTDETNYILNSVIDTTKVFSKIIVSLYNKNDGTLIDRVTIPIVRDGAAGAKGEQGLQGCVIRDSEWTTGTEYRNDSALATTTGVRFIDVALVRNDSAATGWDAYQCLKTHTSSASLTYTNTTYWQKFAANVSAIFTSLIIAKNAKIKFLQGNQLLISKPDGTVTAGMSGSQSGEKVRFWAGSATPDNAPFRVTESGEVYAEEGTFKGEISASLMRLKIHTPPEDLGRDIPNGSLIINCGSPLVFPRLNDGESMVIELAYPLLSRTRHPLTMSGETSDVRLCLDGDVLTSKQSFYFSGIDGGYFRCIGYNDGSIYGNSKRTHWLIMGMNSTSEEILNKAE